MTTPDRSSIPHAPGVYLMRDSAARVIYVGKAKNLAKRVASYFLDRPHIPAKTAIMSSSIRHIDYIPAESEREALLVERSLIHKLQPPFNVMWKDDKSYPYVKLSLGEDFPRLFMTRRKSRDGGAYFGPFPNVQSVRKLLHFLWRQKYFPLRPCRYEFSQAQPLSPEKIKSCLYYHTRECPAPCANRITRDDYRGIAREAELFFSGRRKKLVIAWENEMKEASQNQDFERAAQIRDNLAALKHMAERVTTREIRPDDVAVHVDRSRAISELQKALGLPQPPLRIECFDISHFQGLETVASMVSFKQGVPDKKNYRKFKIRTVAGIDDFASMGEVVGRRYSRLRAEKKPLPDLVLIDGGKGQLSAAQAAIKDALQSARIPPMAALAKREEELFLPDREQPVLLPHDSPALHVVQSVRDEAHRFAVAFHRLRRSKRFLPGGH